MQCMNHIEGPVTITVNGTQYHQMITASVLMMSGQAMYNRIPSITEFHFKNNYSHKLQTTKGNVTNLTAHKKKKNNNT